jgi:gamma-glutamylcyclotransferase (GGCT)/AIG2-like uncharacterized protein YtfP
MSAPELPLFVYGTLRPGASSFGRVAPFARRILPAIVDGFELYDMGPYPMLVVGNGRVLGELIMVEPTVYHYVLHVLDRYEGYDPQADSGLFVRRQILATLESGESVSAWCYLGQPEGAETGRRVASGDWLDAPHPPYWGRGSADGD